MAVLATVLDLKNFGFQEDFFLPSFDLTGVSVTKIGSLTIYYLMFSVVTNCAWP
jgi:hypothetical protein